MAKVSKLTEAIREAIVALRDPLATVGDVRAVILKRHPELEKPVSIGSFRNRVYQQREWARRQIGEQPERRIRRDFAHTQGPGMLERYSTGERFLNLCGGNAKHAEEVLAFLDDIEPTDLRQAYQAWQQLIVATGNAENARRALETMRESGMI